MRRGIFVAGVGAVTAAVAVGVIASSLVAVAVFSVAAVVFIALIISKRRLPIALLILAFLAAFPLPLIFPQSFEVGGGSVFLSDIMSGVVILLVLSGRGSTKMKLIVVAVLATLALFASFGLLSGGDAPALVRDLRGPAEVLSLTSGLIVEVRHGGAAHRRLLLSGLAAMVIGTGLILVFETVTRLEFFDLRSQDAVLYLGHQVANYSATRLTPPNDVLCAISGSVALMLWMQGRVRGTSVWWFWPFVVSGLLVGLANFSRNNLIAMVVVVLAGALLGGRLLRVVGRLVPFLAIGTLFVSSSLFFLTAYSTAARTLLESLWEAFVGRVLGGLNPSTLSVDSSALWRVRESNAAFSSIAERGVLGTGLGHAYRTTLPGEPFTDGSGVFYVHSSYLWVPVKLGLPIAALLLGLLGLLVIRSVRIAWARGADDTAVIAGWSLLALIPVLAVSPLPFSRGGAIVVGVVFALAVVSARSARGDHTMPLASDAAAVSRSSVFSSSEFVDEGVNVRFRRNHVQVWKAV